LGERIRRFVRESEKGEIRRSVGESRALLCGESRDLSSRELGDLSPICTNCRMQIAKYRAKNAKSIEPPLKEEPIQLVFEIKENQRQKMGNPNHNLHPKP
jgi:hypothetical protein